MKVIYDLVINDDTIIFLTNNLRFELLSVKNNKITDKESIALATTQSILYLDIRHNHLSADGIAALRNNPVIQTLYVNDLQYPE